MLMHKKGEKITRQPIKEKVREIEKKKKFV